MLLGPAAPGQPAVLVAAPWAAAPAQLRAPVTENPLEASKSAAGLVESLSCIIGSRLYLPVVIRGAAAALAPADQPGPAAAPTVAPERDPWANGAPSEDFASAHAFLYSGSQPRQTGMQPDVINPVQAAVLRGRVCTRTGSPLPGVTISVLNHPEFGSTLSLADGSFDLAVNGGATLTVNYVKNGFLEAQRQAVVPWLDYAWLDRVVLIPLDSQVTAINLAQAGMQVARGNAVADGDGLRQATLLVPQGTTAELVMSNGVTQSITNLSVRATEYTVGLIGPAAMPGQLPPSSGYTYAVEYSVDQAQAAGAVEVRFSRPLIHYMENFLNFPVGMVVPTGFYDRRTGAWVPSENGRVVKIISVSGGLANLDTDGDGTADNGAVLGVTSAERQHLAGLYQPGQTLWRVPVKHFSPWDCNWPFGPPNGAKKPDQPGPQTDDPKDKPDCRNGSAIECQNQILGESVKIAGTPFSLHYQGDRAPGRTAAFNLQIQLSGAAPPAILKRIDLTVDVAGRHFTQSFPPVPNQSASFTWDGKDAYGNTLNGKQFATIGVGYVYTAVYQLPAQLQQSFAALSGVPLSSNRARGEVTLWQDWQRQLDTSDARAQALGGWTLDVQHVYGPKGKIVYFGDGTRRSSESFSAGVINTVAGGGHPPSGTVGDGGPATSASLFNPKEVAVAPDGAYYIADTSNQRVRRVDTNGVITTTAGTGILGYNGDNIPATQAQLYDPVDVAVGPDGSLYIAERSNYRIRRVRPDGLITTVAGTGTAGYNGDGIAATSAQLNTLYGVAVGPDGSLFIADTGNQRVRRVGPDGIISTMAGTGAVGFAGDGGPATQAKLNNPRSVAIGPDGSLYIADWSNGRIRRVGTDGIIQTVAGSTALSGYGGDGGPATLAQFCAVVGVTAGPDGSFYVADECNNRLRRVGTDGIIVTVAGNGQAGLSGDAGPATRARLDAPGGAAVAPDGSLYIADRFNDLVRRVVSGLPGISATDVVIPSDDAREVYVFDSGGRHLRTLDAMTGAVRYQFNYDGASRLISVMDGDNNTTIITRTGNGIPTAIVGPYGQSTSLVVNVAGYLTRVTNPLGQAYAFTYQPGGLLASLTDPRGNTHTFSYDTLGRLSSDANPAAGITEMARLTTGQVVTVTARTALSRTTTYQVETLPSGDQHRVNTFSNGLQSEYLKKQDGTRAWRDPDGTLHGVTFGPDPRWGMLAPIGQFISLTTPGGLTYNLQVTRTAVLTDTSNPFSLVSLTEVRSINSRAYTITYTAATRTRIDRSPAGRVVTTTLDVQGRVVFEQESGLSPASFSYDNHGRLITATQGIGPEARVVTFGYNSGGYLARVTDPLSRTEYFGYDAAGRVISQTLPDGRVIDYAQDANGNLTEVTPPGRPSHTFGYTAVDLLAQYTPPDVNPGSDATQYSYNPDRQLTLVTPPDGQTTSFGYDSAGRLSALTIARGLFGYTYDGTTGRLAAVSAPGGISLTSTYDGSMLKGTGWSGPVAGSIGYAYDTSSRPISMSVNGGSPIVFQYDADSLLTQAGALSLTRNLMNGLLVGSRLGSISDAWVFNGSAEPISYSAAYSATSLYHVEYDRDKLGRLTGITETIGAVTDLYGYSYDLAGRLTGVTKNGPLIAAYTYDSNGNRLSGPGSGSYDNQDRLTHSGTTTYTYTANGDLESQTTGVLSTTYQYDALGNLTAVTLPGGTPIAYLLDGNNRRIGKRVNGTLVQGFLYQDNLRPIAELDGAGAIVSRFVYATRISLPDYMIRAGVTYRLIADHVGSPRLVVNTATGQIVQRMDYDAFGKVLSDTHPGFQPFGFGGGLYDLDTGLVRFGTRDYDAVTGRWTAKDPIRFDGGDTNLYEYGFSDPLNQIDPNGQGGLGDWIRKKSEDWACKFSPASCCMQYKTKCQLGIDPDQGDFNCGPQLQKCEEEFQKCMRDVSKGK